MTKRAATRPKRRVNARPTAAKRAAKTHRPASDAPPSGLIIVGVGASAGGLEAFSELLASVAPDAGLTLVLVQHLSPSHDSTLTGLLAAHSKLPVTEVTNGMEVERNHVYVIPPNTDMVLSGGALQLSPRAPGHKAHMPIDCFFESLAAGAGTRAMGVVLSGTASDGTAGLRQIKAAGGITFVQSPESAKFDGMPRAAISTGMVDLVLTPAEIGVELSQIAKHALHRLRAKAAEPVGEALMRRVFELLRQSSAVDFRHYKPPTIRRRLLRRMALHRLSDFGRYVELLERDGGEVQALFKDLLIHVTRFFREPESFAALTTEVFPKLIERRDDGPIRMWVCGCASGEEVYSLAIVLYEFLQQYRPGARVQIFATDVSDTAVDAARAAVYPANIAADVGPERLRRFFTRTDGHYRVNKPIREMCVFARQDLTRDPPFSRLDLVMCRNVLIYLNVEAQRKLVSVFHYALNPEGHLVLGQAESVGSQASLFTLIDKRFRIHRKKSDYVARQLARSRDYASVPALRPPAPAAADPDRGLQVAVSKLILDRYAPAGVLVDDDLHITQVRGQTGRYLEHPPGEANLNLLKMLREGLVFGVRAALDAARESKQPIRREGLRVRAGAGWRNVDVEVIPLVDAARPHFLVLFEDRRTDSRLNASPDTDETPKRASKRPPKRSEIADLQRELDSSRSYMQSIIQQLEAANEELQSANEEILSSNEELQSTNEELDTAKEELQSTNEELNTVNEELQVRNDEMGRINSDLVNLVGSVQIAIVIVSNDLRIRRFTSMAEKVLNLIPADLDRSIAHINPNIDCPNLPDLILESIDSVSPVERDVRDRQGRWYALRIRPYKSLDNRIDGAVLALFDIDLLKRSEQSMQRAQAFADGLLDGIEEPVAVLTRQFRVHKANVSFARMFSSTPAELNGRVLDEVDGLAHELGAWRAYHDRLVPGEVLPTIALMLGTPLRRMLLSAWVVPSPSAPDETLLVMAIHPAERPDAV